jgi:hypothetical protein
LSVITAQFAIRKYATNYLFSEKWGSLSLHGWYLQESIFCFTFRTPVQATEADTGLEDMPEAIAQILTTERLQK